MTTTQKTTAMEAMPLAIFTRTSLHVGDGSSVGAIDLTICRERHTNFPVIPASTLKGSFADHWNEVDASSDSESQAEEAHKVEFKRSEQGHWLFGRESGSDQASGAAGALVFQEARLIAFPVRSAKGCYAWVTCPKLLQRACSDGFFSEELASEILNLAEPSGSDQLAGAFFPPESPLALENKLVLEEFCLVQEGGNYPAKVASTLKTLLTDTHFDPQRLVILDNGMMSHFTTTACEIAQHVCIDDSTGTAKKTGLFNQENVPADSLFYTVIRATRGKDILAQQKSPAEALQAFKDVALSPECIHQFGANITTGLGFCSLYAKDPS